MLQTYFRILCAILLAAALELPHIVLQNAGWLGTTSAYAQVIPDPGFGDPYATGGYGDQRIDPRTGVLPPQAPLNFGPTGPAAPMSPTRPAGWPGGPAGASQTTAPPSRGGYPSVAPGMPGGYPAQPPVTAASAMIKKSPTDPPYDPAVIVAHVGSEVIQASEVLVGVNQYLAAIAAQHAEELAKLSPQEREEQFKPLRRDLMKRSLDDVVKVKMLVAELRRKVPAEGLAKHEKQMREYFNSREIKRLMDEHKAASIPDLETKLRVLGSSLESQRQVFVERQLAGSWLNEHTKDEPQPATHEELLTYYKLHAADWDSPARVRWEQVSVKFSNFNSKQEAYSALARWGNEIMRGAPFAAVAKAHSQGFAADEGGIHDWASQGSLRSTVLDEALFALPEGQLSRILEDEDGFHIVRVIQREPARRAPFTEVQREIKKTLKDGGKEKRQADYLAKLREKTPVTTIFDEDFVARTQGVTPSVTR